MEQDNSKLKPDKKKSLSFSKTRNKLSSKNRLRSQDSDQRRNTRRNCDDDDDIFSPISCDFGRRTRSEKKILEIVIDSEHDGSSQGSCSSKNGFLENERLELSRKPGDTISEPLKSLPKKADSYRDEEISSQATQTSESAEKLSESIKEFSLANEIGQLEKNVENSLPICSTSIQRREYANEGKHGDISKRKGDSSNDSNKEEQSDIDISKRKGDNSSDSNKEEQSDIDISKRKGDCSNDSNKLEQGDWLETVDFSKSNNSIRHSPKMCSSSIDSTSPVHDDNIVNSPSTKRGVISKVKFNTSNISLHEDVTSNAHSSSCDDRASVSCGVVCSDEDSKTGKHFTCPLCFKVLENNEKQVIHLKVCATRHNITTRQLLDAVELQKRQIAERQALGLPVVPTAQAVKKSVPRKNVNSSTDPNLQLALALSASMQDAEEQEQLQRDECLIEAGLGHEVVERQKTMLERFGFTSTRSTVLSPSIPRVKPATKSRKTVPLLMSRTKEERERLVTEKVAIILMDDENTSDISQNKSNHIASEVSTELQKYQRKTNMLWDMVSLSDSKTECSSYYVSELSKFISPCKVKAGDKLKHLSQIPGRVKTPKRITGSVPVLQESLAARDPEFQQKITPTKGTEINWKQSEGRGVLADKNSLAETLIGDWKALLNKKVMSDLTIHVENEIEIPAHKLVLYVRCRAVLNDVVSEISAGNSKKTSDMLLWVDVSFKAALAFLQFLYCGLTSKILLLDEEDFSRVKRLSQRYKVTELLEHLKVVNSVRTRLGKKGDVSPKSLSQKRTPHKMVRRKLTTLSVTPPTTHFSRSPASLSSSKQMTKKTTVSNHLLTESHEISSVSDEIRQLNSTVFQESEDFQLSNSGSMSPDMFVENLEQTNDCHDLKKLTQESMCSMNLLLQLMGSSTQTQSVSQTKDINELPASSSSKTSTHTRPVAQEIKNLSVKITNASESDVHNDCSDHLLAGNDSLHEKHDGIKDTDRYSLISKLSVISTSTKDKSTPKKSPTLSEMSTPIKNKSAAEASAPAKDKTTSKISPTFSEMSTPVKDKSKPKTSPTFSEMSTPIRNKSSSNVLSTNSDSNESLLVSDDHNESRKLLEEVSANAETTFDKYEFLESLIAVSPHTTSEKCSKDNAELKRKCDNDSANDYSTSFNKRLCRESLENEKFEMSCEKLEHTDKHNVSGTLLDKVEVLDLTQTSSDSDSKESKDLTVDRCTETSNIANKCISVSCNSRYMSEEIPEDIISLSEKTIKVTKDCVLEEDNFVEKKEKKDTKNYVNTDWDEFDVMCNMAEPHIFTQSLSQLISTKKPVTVKSPSKVESKRTIRPASTSTQKSPLKNQSSRQSVTNSRLKSGNSNRDSANKERSPDTQQTSTSESGLEELLLAQLNESVLWRDENAPAMKSSVEGAAATNSDNNVDLQTPTQNRKRCRYADQVTPPADYSSMKTPQLKKELTRFGLKPSLTKKQAKKMLRYIYDQLHPYITASDSDDTVEETKEGSSVFKKPDSDTHIPKSPVKKHLGSPVKKNTVGPKALPQIRKQTNSKSDAESEYEELPLSQESSSSGTTSIVEEMFFEDIHTQLNIPMTQNVSSDDLPSVVRNFITTNPEMHQKVLLYEPIWLEELHSDLKANNFKFKMDQLMDYLDEQCITFRTAQGQRNRQRKKQKQDAKRRNISKKRKGKPGIIGNKSPSSSSVNSSFSSN